MPPTDTREITKHGVVKVLRDGIASGPHESPEDRLNSAA